MNLQLIPAPLCGAVTPPSSKSEAHRLMIAAMLADGTSTLTNLGISKDLIATMTCAAQMASLVQRGDEVQIVGNGGRSCVGETLPCFHCGESGSTLRFFIPLALALMGGGVFTGEGRLLQRPQRPYADLCAEHGISFVQTEEKITVAGKLEPGVFRLPGNVSSQFITGLLFTLPLLEGDSMIEVTTPLESRDYVLMTLDVMERFGVSVTTEDWQTYVVHGRQCYQPRQEAAQADWSQAGFWYAAQGVGNGVEVLGMKTDTCQGDRRMLDFHHQLQQPGDVTLDVSQCPDLVPPLAAYGALRAGSICHIVNAARLRLKESDRLAAVTHVLNAMGAQVTEGEDSLTIVGQSQLAGGVAVDAHNDHRIAMMAAVAATRCQQPITVLGAECVQKSYPDFWEQYTRLGGQLREV